MANRPLVSVHIPGQKGTSEQLPLPDVFTVPIRNDIVHEVHSRMSKNRRQPYAVSKYAGHQTSAESYGTGRAVARIPRVGGGGTHRSGQGAFGNMCRGGRMFAPTKIYRQWHRKIAVNERRYATVSAIAATAVPSLVMARGHKIERVLEIPYVLDNKVLEGLEKTKNAVALLKQTRAFTDVEKVIRSKKVRAGKGKARNRRYVRSKGPLVIYKDAGTFCRAFRNIPGIEMCSVNKLNLLQLAPGGHLGRFVIWTKDAFEHLNTLYGQHGKPSEVKKNYVLPRPMMTNADLSRIINSDEVQAVLRSKQPKNKSFVRKKNALKNLGHMIKLNPYARVQKRNNILRQRKAIEAKKAKLDGKGDKKASAALRKTKKDIKKKRAAIYKRILS